MVSALIADAVGVQLTIADLPGEGRLVPDLTVVHLDLVDESTPVLFFLGHHLLYEAVAVATVDPLNATVPGDLLESVGRLG